MAGHEHKGLEDIYRSRFRVVQFLQRVSANPKDGLVLPKTFVKNLRENLGGTVVLKTPSESEWAIEVGNGGNGDGDGDILLLKNGWKEFALAHCLGKDDTIVFTYHGNSKFDVTMFDANTGCEKVCSYFVRKEVTSTVETQVNLKECASERKTDKNKYVNDDCHYVSSHKKGSTTTNGSISGRTARKRLVKHFSEDDHEFVSSQKHRRVSSNTRGVVVSGRMARKLLGARLFEGGTSDDLSDIGEMGTSNGGEQNGGSFNNSAGELVPKGRVATESEKKRTLERAQKEANDRHDLLVSMCPSYVNHRPCLSFSSRWARDHGLIEKQEVELHVDGNPKKFIARFYYRDCSAGMSKGWKTFVTENGLEEGDVCLFNVIPDTQNPVAFNVRIFHIADDIAKTVAE